MCGIVGIWRGSPGGQEELLSQVQAMNDTLVHRGPDDGGVWADGEFGVALGNRRLAILDLSRAGHQPMVSACGRYVIVYNGEFYNFDSVRRELEALGKRFHSHTDTEVIVEGCAQWGVRSMVERMNGMFAFALWDRQAFTLTLVRDRLGIKPLYYGWIGKTFLFGSELKALNAYPNFNNKVSRNSLALFMRHNYIPAPYTIYEGVYKLPAGHLLVVRPGGEVAQDAFWSAKRVVEVTSAQLCWDSEESAAVHLDALLRDAVRLRMIADVPLGAFLSGGVDSSTVVALMQAQSSRPVKTFSIGFLEEGYNEAHYARKVARHLRTDHTELYVTPKEARAVIPKLAWMYDEPFSDSSQIPTFLVAQLTRQHVTVSLSGDGGDELFGGYPRYYWTQDLWRVLRLFPPFLCKMGSKAIRSFSSGQWERVLNSVKTLVFSKSGHRWTGDRIHRAAELLLQRSPEAVYHQLVSHWKSPEELVIGACEPLTALTDEAQWAERVELIERLMYLDLVTYLPGDILTKVDRASMSVSLEARVPFLDHRVVEFIWQLPLSWKIRNGQSKWLLRRVLYRYVPPDLIERPKMGFGVPIDTWLRGPLCEWAEALLSEDRLRREGYFQPELIRQKWSEHLSGQRNWQGLLWNVLMFQAWKEQWVK